MTATQTEHAQQHRSLVLADKARFLYFMPEKPVAATLKKYLDRTSLFWNFLVEHLEPSYAPYLKKPISASQDHAFSVFAERLLEQACSVVESDVPIVQTNIEAKWQNALASIMELPRHVLDARLEDLLTAYRQASQNLIEEEPGKFIINPYTSVPRLKNDRSTQSVRFMSQDFTMYGDLFTISKPYPVTILIPGLEKLAKGEVQSATISKIVSRSNFTFGPEGKLPEVRYKLSLPPESKS